MQRIERRAGVQVGRLAQGYTMIMYRGLEPSGSAQACLKMHSHDPASMNIASIDDVTCWWGSQHGLYQLSDGQYQPTHQLLSVLMMFL